MASASAIYSTNRCQNVKLCDVPVGQTVIMPAHSGARFTVLEHITGRGGPETHLVRVQREGSPYEETDNGQADVEPAES